MNSEKDEIIAEGKTKIIVRMNDDPDNVEIISKNDITAGDGAKHDLIVGKAALATETTCNVFEMLKGYGVPVAYNKRVNSTTFSAPRCTMFPYEVVVRRQAYGSCLKRMPALTKGESFPDLCVEFFLKTKNREWKGYILLCDDPLMVYSKEDKEISLYEAAKPFDKKNPFLVLREGEVFNIFDEWKLFSEMEEIAKRTFIILESKWKARGGTLVDFKVEFGLTKDGALLLADVIDNDSWRVIVDDVHVDKQAYRDGNDLTAVAKRYRYVAEMTKHFLSDLEEK